MRITICGTAAAEMAGRGHRLLVEVKLEPWGQTVARLLSPEGLLVGIVHTPWMHPNPQAFVTEAGADDQTTLILTGGELRLATRCRMRRAGFTARAARIMGSERLMERSALP